MTRRILISLESRATYGYSRNVMRAMAGYPELELTTLVTGMHLMPELGNSIELIRADGFPATATVPFAPADDGRGAWSRAMGQALSGYAEAMERLNPDIVLVSGDRAESFAVTVAAAYMSLPVAHIQAGDKSGHIDDASRMAIGKLAHIHLASCEDSARRLTNLGEQDFRIFNVGAPQLDDIVSRDFKQPAITLDGTPHDLAAPYLLLVQHSVLAEHEEAGRQMAASLQACLSTGLKVFYIYPNSDLGYTDIVRAVESAAGAEQLVKLRNLERDDFLTLLAGAACLVGNSSSGILEAPSFKVPVINIGNRQRGRPQASNILNCGWEVADIRDRIATALGDAAFQASCATAINPYGDGKSGPRICEVLRDIPLDRRLIDKETVY